MTTALNRGPRPRGGPFAGPVGDRLFLDVQLEAGGEYKDVLPSNFDGFVYIYRGDGRFGADKTPARESQYFQLGDGDQFTAAGKGGGGQQLG